MMIPDMKGGAARWAAVITAGVVIAAMVIGQPRVTRADTTPVVMLDPNLQVRTVLTAADGLSQPIGIVFLAANDYLVLEKATGQVKRVIGGVVQPTPVLDLAVNSNSERGLLSLVLHPAFPVTSIRLRSLDREQHRRRLRRRSPTCRCSAIASTASSGTARR